MFWIEKIEILKKKYLPADFKDPFRNGPTIIEKIIYRMLETTWVNFHNSLHRETLIKDGRLTRSCTIDEFYTDEIQKLNTDDHYWLLLVHVPLSTDFRVYDCTFEPLQQLLYLSSNESSSRPYQEFFIVDKKFRWLQFFKIDTMKDCVKIYESKNYT